MKNQIITIGLIIGIVLTSSYTQARNFRMKRGPRKQHEQVQQETAPIAEPNPVQDNDKPEPEQVQDSVKPEPAQTIIQVQRATQSQDFSVSIMVDHENQIYHEGELMNVTVESSRSGYLYLFYKDASGNVAILFPNKFHQDNKIEANKTVLIPDSSMNFKLRTSAPFGKEVLQAIVTIKPLDLPSVINFQNDIVINTLSAGELTDLEKTINQEEDLENEKAECTICIETFPAEQATQAQKKRIFIGVCSGKFNNNRLRVVSACENDVLEMARFFTDNGAVELNESLIFRNEEVTRDRIRDLFLNYLPNHTNPGDEIFIYWTGFSGRCIDIDGDEEDGFDETLLLYDSDPEDMNTQIIDDEFCRWTVKLRGRKVLFIFDVSYGFGLSEFTSLKSLGLLNFAYISSCSTGEMSLLMNDQQMSVMTSFMLETLNKNHKISHKKLFSKVKPKVAKYVKKYNVEQNMIMLDNLDSPMILNP